MSALFRIFRRKKTPPLACHLSLDGDESHVHGAACFLDVQPLALAELFQSQSCASCPPAVPSILAATNHPNLLHLTYDVTYFDHSSGWKDTFSNPRWDARQREYVRRWGRTSLYTPMLVVNGVADGGSGGGTAEEIDGVVRRARELGDAQGWHIVVDANETGVRIDSDKQELAEGQAPFDVIAVVYDDKTETVKIGAGPNKRKKVPHKNVVKEIVRIGEWRGGNVVLSLPVPPSQLEQGTAAVVLVQEPHGGPIVAVGKVI